MQTADVMVALGGDKGTTVPKSGITVSEIAVLQAIHGNDAVHDIEPTGTIERTSREEIRRLREIYGNAKQNNVSIMDTLFPGAAARAFTGFDELEIDESFFKPISRAKAPVAETAAEPAPKAKRAKKAAEDPEQEADDKFEDDEQPEGNDGKLFG